MSVSIQTNVTMPDFSLSDMKERTKNNPYVDGFQHYPVGQNTVDKDAKKKYNPYLDDPVEVSAEGVWSKAIKIKLPRFFNSIIEKRVNEVAMMVLFHIIHFFCQKFWKNYRIRFEGKLAFKKEREKEAKKFKLDQLLLGAKVDKLHKKTEVEKKEAANKEAEKNALQEGSMSLFDKLPTDMIHMIMGYLPHQDRKNLALTCKSVYKSAKSYDSLYKKV